MTGVDIELGIGPRTFRFLRGLAAHNDKVWFDAHRTDYEEHVREPFVVALEACAAATVRGPWPLSGGKPTMFRINRDVRFATDKSPYKTAVGGLLTPDGSKSAGAGVGYLHLAAGGGFVACGHYQLSPARLGPVRDAILEHDDDFAAVLDDLGARGRSMDTDDDLSAMPRGYSEHTGHRHAAMLRHRSFIVTQPLTERDWQQGDVVAALASLVADCAELVRFVGRAR